MRKTATGKLAASALSHSRSQVSVAVADPRLQLVSAFAVQSDGEEAGIFEQQQEGRFPPGNRQIVVRHGEGSPLAAEEP